MTPYQEFYVYTHTDPTTNEIVYVGHGKGSRAWSECRDSGHAAWMRTLFQLGYTMDEFVKVYAKHLSKKEACAIEASLIVKYKPVYNKLSNSNFSHIWSKWDTTTKTTIKTLHNNGYSYSQIAYLMGGQKKNAMSMWRICNG